MPVYEYTAKRGPGRPETGEIRAASEAEALAALDADGYIPIRVQPRGVDVPDRRHGSIRFHDITLFTRQMAGLLKAGVPMLRALATVSGQSSNTRFAGILERVSTAIRNGSTFSAALSEYPRVFSPLYVSMVRAGESAGALDQILWRLAEEREKQDDRWRRVQAALAYPVLLIMVGAATVFVLLAFFMPRVAALFEGWGRLPWPTRVLLAVSGWVSEYRMAILLSIALPLALLHRVARTRKGRLWLDRRILRLPLMGRLLLHHEIARFSRTLALLIKAGVAIGSALALAADTIRNRALRAEVQAVRQATVQQGRAFSEGLQRGRGFPPFLITMISVGEQSGRIDETLEETASFYEKEIDRMSNMATSLLEPALILVIGGLVGFIVAAMLLPIFEFGAVVR